jgi:hypothetical protein
MPKPSLATTKRISMDLGDPVWIRLLKSEAQETNSTMREVLIRALEGHFAPRLESKSVSKVSESVFEEWNNPLDSEYDRL